MIEPPLNSDRIPRHIAIIMDGNGRWAQARGISRNEGHKKGLEALRSVIRSANELGVRWLTLYAFSLENWNRPKMEVASLMGLLERYLEIEIDEVMEKGIRLRSIGRPDRLPKRLQKKVDRAIARTQGNTNMTLVFALSYGGRSEIVDAARKLLRDAELGKIDPESLDEKTFAAYLYDPEVPDPDLLIRTGAELRVSNFLLWQIAYTEIYSTDVMWPDFGERELIDAVRDYQSRERRFGLTSEQVRGARDVSR
ncbi:MAG: isoprenyl transferase [Deltaproteobacteria bacterium]|jgi:undecaprenyl diphosphate synthase|nr:isoprenyl transferase [Deltaproteobacteria bacterium]MBW2543080.1 isoprenyl transferase [Deltaproteobacteria bacterium]